MTTENIQGKAETTAQGALASTAAAPTEAQQPVTQPPAQDAAAPATVGVAREEFEAAMKGYQRRIRLQDDEIKRQRSIIEAMVKGVQSGGLGDDPDAVKKVMDKAASDRAAAEAADAFSELEDLTKNAGWKLDDPRLAVVNTLGKLGDFQGAVSLARTIVKPEAPRATQPPQGKTYNEADVKAEVERRVQEEIRKKIPRDPGAPSAPASDVSGLSPFEKIKRAFQG